MVLKLRIRFFELCKKKISKLFVIFWRKSESIISFVEGIYENNNLDSTNTHTFNYYLTSIN